MKNSKETETFKTSSGGTWRKASIRTSMPISNGKLTGNWEEQEVFKEKVVMLEVDHDFGKDFIFESLISQ